MALLKTLTISRLELFAALLGVKLIDQILKSRLPAMPVYYWSDSQIVLCWIKKNPKDLQVFVANRISQIQQSSNVENWYYVNTKENPADLASRGVLPENLTNSKIWWEGPEFLYGNLEPSLTSIDDCSISLPEMKQSTKIFHTREFFFYFPNFRATLNSSEQHVGACDF